MIRSRATFPDARGSRSGAVCSPRARRRGDFCLVSSAIPLCTGMTAIGQKHLGFVWTRWGIEYSRERVRQVMHALGLRWRRLRHRYLKAKREEQAACVAELEEWWLDWPEEWELIFVDEAPVRRRRGAHRPRRVPYQCSMKAVWMEGLSPRLAISSAKHRGPP